MTDTPANTTPANTTPAVVVDHSEHKEVSKSFDDWLAATGTLFGALTHAASKALTKNDEIQERKDAIAYIIHDKKVSYEEAVKIYDDFLYFRKTNADPGSLEHNALDPNK